MARKILSWILIILGSVFLILGIVAIIAIWIYKGPLEREAVSRLEGVDRELALVAQVEGKIVGVARVGDQVDRERVKVRLIAPKNG